MAESANHKDCRQFLIDGMAKLGVDATVSTEPPIVQSPYGENSFICPHGTRFWLEPTSEQIAQWAKDGAR
ncbi:hypothetical protein F9C11_21630 [Amycolatopsis sp. VS8301801F10]|uniref:hypothetical protein n=1 Tax=Amycolatopsis sp. VS8301801F10 TaxID=2652442 RepID=UPI0038FBFA23